MTKMTDKDLYLSWFNNFTTVDRFVEHYQYSFGGTPDKPFLTKDKALKIIQYYRFEIDPVIVGKMPEYIEEVSDG